jgi:hypothetical protein
MHKARASYVWCSAQMQCYTLGIGGRLQAPAVQDSVGPYQSPVPGRNVEEDFMPCSRNLAVGPAVDIAAAAVAGCCAEQSPKRA